MYDDFRSRRNRDASLSHQGDWRRAYTQHLEECSKTLAGAMEPSELRSRLMGRICSERILRNALGRVASRASATGPDGVPIDLVMNHPWPWCEQLSKCLHSGEYRHGRVRRVNIAKPGGGRREIHIPNLCDRVVAKAVVMVLEPLLDPLFARVSFGFRPQRGVFDALGALRHRLLCGSGAVVVAADVAEAFDHVPLVALRSVVVCHCGEEIADLAERIAGTSSAIGLRQGSPLSPFLFNCFADRYIDTVWASSHPVALLRYADDLALVAPDETSASELRGHLDSLCRRAGTPLKAAKEPWRDLGSGKHAEWLGFEISKAGGDVVFTLAEKRWEKLEHNLRKCHHASAQSATQLADRVVQGWLYSAGPCRRSVAVTPLLDRVRSVGRDCGFDELPPDEMLVQWLDGGSLAAAGRFRMIEESQEAAVRAAGEEDVALDDSFPF